MSNNRRKLEKELNNMVKPDQVVPDELGRVVDRLDDSITKLEEVKQSIDNLPEPPKELKMEITNHPDTRPIQIEMKVTQEKITFPDVQKVEVLNQVKIPPVVIPSEVSVKEPMWWKPNSWLPEVKGFFQGLFDQLQNLTFKVRIEKTEETPKGFNILDLKGKPVDPYILRPIINTPSYPSPQTYGGRIDHLKISGATGKLVDTSTVSGSEALKVDVVQTTGASGGTSAADGATYTAGTTSGTPAMGARDDTAPGAVAEDKVGILRMSTRRELYAQLRDAAGNERGANVTASNALVVDASGTAVPVTDNAGSLTVDNAGTFAVQAAQSGTWTVQPGNTANTTAWKVDGSAVTQPVSGTVTANAGTGNFAENLAQVNGNTVLTGNGVTGTGSQRVTIASDNTAFAVNSTLSAETTKVIGTVNIAASQTIAVTQSTASSLNAQVVGEVAHDGVDSGNPQKIGGQARQTNPTAVADADRTNAIFDDLGRQVVILNNVRDLVTQATTTISTTTETTILAAGAAGVFHDITSLDITNTSATAVRVDIRDATAGTVRMSKGIAANGGIAKIYNTPWVQITPANNWTAQLSAAVTDIRIDIQAVKNV